MILTGYKILTKLEITYSKKEQLHQSTHLLGDRNMEPALVRLLNLITEQSIQKGMRNDFTKLPPRCDHLNASSEPIKYQ